MAKYKRALVAFDRDNNEIIEIYIGFSYSAVKKELLEMQGYNDADREEKQDILSRFEDSVEIMDARVTIK